ncbi:MAG: hypothetical protein EBR85_09905 [Betaproteobacteria bacterium]|nr:hypothetical protein [Betaproteobacteria bacterium]
MIKQAVVLGFCLAAGAQAQVISDSKQAVGGGGRYAIIATKTPEPKDPAPPQNLRANMRYITPGTVLAKQKVDGKTWIQLEVHRKDFEGRELWVADHPDADRIGVQQKAVCIVVMGPSHQAIQGRQVAYWFASGDYDLNYVRAFEMRRPGVPLE